MNSPVIDQKVMEALNENGSSKDAVALDRYLEARKLLQFSASLLTPDLECEEFRARYDRSLAKYIEAADALADRFKVIRAVEGYFEETLMKVQDRLRRAGAEAE